MTLAAGLLQDSRYKMVKRYEVVDPMETKEKYPRAKPGTGIFLPRSRREVRGYNAPFGGR